MPEPEHPDEDEPGLKGYHICVQWPQVSSCQVAVAGVGMDLDLPLESGMALDFSVPPAPSACAGRDGEAVVSSDWNVYAVTTCAELQHVRAELVPHSERLATLAKQGPIWRDDELLFGLQHLALHTDPEQKVAVWDPLLITGLLVDSNSRTWQQLIEPLGEIATVVSVVALDNHWFPLVWRLDGHVSKLFSCGVQQSHVPSLDFLNSIVGASCSRGSALALSRFGFFPGRSLWCVGLGLCEASVVGFCSGAYGG